MDVQGLQIGNWVTKGKRKPTFEQVKDISLSHREKSYNINFCSQKEFSPIPVTEDWLNKLGFNKDAITGDYSLNGYTVFIKETACYLAETITDYKIAIFLYVHELQNLLYVLTKKI